MTNQNVQTNRHGPQNKGCNQASADSKHYLVSKLRPPCPWAWTKEISVEACVRDLGSLLMARHWQKHQKQFWKLLHCRDWLDHDQRIVPTYLNQLVEFYSVSCRTLFNEPFHAKWFSILMNTVHKKDQFCLLRRWKDKSILYFLKICISFGNRWTTVTVKHINYLSVFFRTLPLYATFL